MNVDPSSRIENNYGDALCSAQQLVLFSESINNNLFIPVDAPLLDETVKEPPSPLRHLPQIVHDLTFASRRRRSRWSIISDPSVIVSLVVVGIPMMMTGEGRKEGRKDGKSTVPLGAQRN